MSQYRTGTVAVTNASAAVVGTGTLWNGNISAGHVFTVVGSLVPYVVASVTDDTHLTLSSNYGGTTGSGLNYLISTSVTPSRKIPYVEDRDLDTATIIKQAMLQIDALLSTFVSPNAKAGAVDDSAVLIKSSDGSNPLQIFLTMGGNAAAGSRYMGMQATEAGVSARVFRLQRDGGAVILGSAAWDALSQLQLSGALGFGTAGAVNDSKTTVASAATPDVWTSTGRLIDFTGNTTVTGFAAAPQAGASRVLLCASTPQFTNGANLLCPGGANYTAATGDMIMVTAVTTSQFRLTVFKASGLAPVTPTVVSGALGADVALNNTANYFDGPTIAQGTVGTWDVKGTVTLEDTAGGAQYDVKLWDGTTVIASARTQHTGASQFTTCSLSGVISTPAGNLRISAKDISSTSGKIIFNATGNSKDSTITALRIA